MDTKVENEQFYVRWRGKQTGPFGLEQLKEMAAEDRLSRLHDVSTDRAEWRRAETIADVYPPYDPGAAEPPEPAADVAAEPTGPTEGAAPGASDDEEVMELESVEDNAGQWYFARAQPSSQQSGGAAQDFDVKGPHPPAVIMQLVINGYLSRDDYVNPGTSASGWRLIRDEPEFTDTTASVSGRPSAARAGANMSAGALKDYSDLAGTSLKLAVMGILVPVFGFAGMICGIQARLGLAHGGDRDAASSATGGIILGIVDILLDVVKTLLVLRLLGYL